MYVGRNLWVDGWVDIIYLPFSPSSLSLLYTQAVACQHHGVAFYVAAPFTSFDLTLASGKQIVIEERPAKELTHVQGQQVG